MSTPFIYLALCCYLRLTNSKKIKFLEPSLANFSISKNNKFNNYIFYQTQLKIVKTNYT